MASGFWSMLLLRLLPGAAQAPDRPSSVAAICCWFPLRSRSRSTSVALSAQYIGPVIVSIATGVLAYRDGWRFCFIAYALVGFAGGVLWRALTKRYPDLPSRSLPRPAPSIWSVVVISSDPSFAARSSMLNQLICSDKPSA
jgi:MFS family permease